MAAQITLLLIRPLRLVNSASLGGATLAQPIHPRSSIEDYVYAWPSTQECVIATAVGRTEAPQTLPSFDKLQATRSTYDQQDPSCMALLSVCGLAMSPSTYLRLNGAY